jgi:hypothetical protein
LRQGWRLKMKSSGPLKHFILAFVIAIALYLLSYNFIENRRTRNGPWRVTFTNESRSPALVINEPKLKIANLKIVFVGESIPSTNTSLVFAQPQPVPFDVPFGKCVFEDTTFQPGTIVFELFGHEVQLLPRTLTIDKQDHAWQSDETISVNKADTSRGVP